MECEIFETDVDSDYIYESQRDDKDIENMEKMDKDALKQELEPSVQGMTTCFECELEFDSDDMDIVDGEWLCRQCEENKK